jgi:Cu2+-exporting ATPase
MQQHTHDHHNKINDSAMKAKPMEVGRPERQQQRSTGAHRLGTHAHHDEHAGHDKHAGRSIAMFRRKFWVSLVLTIPTLVWGHMLQSALRYTAPHFPGAMWTPAAFGTAVFVYGGWVFIEEPKAKFAVVCPE